jgi:hypothetical protein
MLEQKVSVRDEKEYKQYLNVRDIVNQPKFVEEFSLFLKKNDNYVRHEMNRDLIEILSDTNKPQDNQQEKQFDTMYQYILSAKMDLSHVLKYTTRWEPIRIWMNLTHQAKTNTPIAQGFYDQFLENYINNLEKSSKEYSNKDKKQITKSIFEFYIASGKIDDEEMTAKIQQLSQDNKLDTELTSKYLKGIELNKDWIKSKIIPYKPSKEVIQTYTGK